MVCLLSGILGGSWVGEGRAGTRIRAKERQSGRMGVAETETPRLLGERPGCLGCVRAGRGLVAGVERELRSDPAGYAGVEEVEGEGAAGEHFVVEGADVEVRAELLRGAGAELADF